MALLALLNRPLLLLIISLVLSIAIWRSVYRFFRGPLSNIPGPAISRWTNWQLKLAVLRGDRARYIHKLHRLYGPIVRVAPNEISLADQAAAKVLYKVGGQFNKTEWYDDFTGNQPARNMFSSTDFNEHSQLRKLFSSSFSEKWIADMEPFIAKNTRLAVARMADEASQQGYTDCFKWFTFMATDVIGEASFGESFEMLRTGKKNQYISDLESLAGTAVLRSEFSRFFKAVRKIPVGPAKAAYAVVSRMNGYADESLRRYYRQYNADPENVKPTLLTKEYGLFDEGHISWAQLRRDASGFIIAGTDTTAITTTNAVWLLSKHPEIEQQLIREVSTLPTDFTDHDLQQVESLQIILKEVLRLRGAVAQGLPRLVPDGGVEFCGYYIPAGVVCGAQAYTLHRDPTVWSQPEVFDPARWKEPTKAMRDSYYAFGGGSRICIGMHFAQLEMRHALANFYRTFESGMRMSSAEGMSEDDMVPMCYFLEPPKGKRCMMERRK